MQFADDDVFVGGPIVQALSKSFDEFWNSDLVVPAGRSVNKPYQPPAAIPVVRGSGIDYVARINTGEPYASLISGRQRSSGRRRKSSTTVPRSNSSRSAKSLGA